MAAQHRALTAAALAGVVADGVLAIMQCKAALLLCCASADKLVMHLPESTSLSLCISTCSPCTKHLARPFHTPNTPNPMPQP